jgi:alpha-tubulin suppressor-like RCC1 family protein
MIRRLMLVMAGCCWLSVASSAPAVAGPVAAGGSHTVVVTPAGQVWVWGANGSGQLGDGTTTSRTIPTLVPALTGVIAVAAGNLHTLALTNDGTVWAWGHNGYGQLGDATTTQRLTPVQVAVLNDVIAIAAGKYHSVALRADGSVWTWGLNNEGQLGNGTLVSSSQPVYIAGAGTATAIGAGQAHTLVVRADGTAWAWGRNSYGQLGDNSTTQRLEPVAMTGVTSAASVAGGEQHSLVRRGNGSVVACGQNSVGQLGDGTTIQRKTAVPVSGLTSVADIAAGIWHSLAVRSDGTLWAWGSNGNGQLGDGTTTSRALPIGPILSDLGTVAAASHTVVVTPTGIVRTWGSNSSGQLGDGTTIGRTWPTAISDAGYAWWVSTPVFSVATGIYTVSQTVTITAATPGAEIHYTLTGDDPTEADAAIASGASILIDQTRTLKARAWKTGSPPSAQAMAAYTLAVAPVSVSPTSGTFPTPQTVTMSTTTPGAVVRYTTNGTAPTDASALYTAPIVVGTTTLVQAAGFKLNWSPSTPTTRTYTMNFGTLAAPTPTPPGGSYASSVVVTLSALPGASVRYTTDGTTPYAGSPLYAGPFELSASRTVKAIALHPDYTTSPITTAVYTVVVAAPTLTPGAGTYAPDQTIRIESATPGATLRFTLTGLDPTDTDPTIASGGTLVVGAYTLKVKATKTGCTPSAVTTAAYHVSAGVGSGVMAAGDQHVLAARPDGVTWTWGQNVYGQLGDGTTTPRLQPVIVGGITGVRAVAAGASHSLALAADETLWAWGAGYSGQLGHGGSSNRSWPVAVTGLSSVVAVAAGANHSVAVKADGTVWAWGANNQGQLGDGTTTQRLAPVQVVGLTGVLALAAGGSSTLAVKADGTVWAWGNNGNGQLGDGTTTSRLTPVVVTGLTGITAVAAGAFHALALRGDGTVLAWGFNGQGRLGDGTTTQRLTPVAVQGLAGIARVAAGGSHSLAADTSGGVWAWGDNSYGQLGDGTTTSRTLAALVAGLPEMVAVTAGQSSAHALAGDGTIWSWGRNTGGQLGDGTTIDRMVPVAISGPGFSWTVATPTLSLAAGRYTTAQSVTVTCSDPAAVLHYTTAGVDPTEGDPVIASGGTVPVNVSLTLKVRGWKAGAPPSVVVGAAYELKVMTATMSPSSGSYTTPPSIVVATPTPGSTLTYTLDGTEPTSGSAAYTGPLLADRLLTIKAVAFKTGWTPSDTAAGSYFVHEGIVATPVLTPAGGTMTTPTLVTATTATPGATLRYTLDGTTPSQASARYREPLLVSETTTVTVRAYKSGWTSSSSVAATFTNGTPDVTPPPTVSPAGGRFITRQTVTITGPAGATLRYTLTGADPTEGDATIPVGGTLVVDRALVLKVRAWQSGLAPSTTRRAAFLVTGAVAAGIWHSVALAADSTVYGWGYNYFGQVGDGGFTTRLTPVAVATGAVAIAAGEHHTLAVKEDGTALSWGQNSYGQLGNGTTSARPTPGTVSGLTQVVAVAAGQGHSLALRADGTVWAWGRNTDGQLGDGTTSNRTTPVPVVGLSGVTAVAAGGDFSLAVVGDGAEAGTVWAWGANASGQLGDGTTTSRPLPVRVPEISGIARLAAGRDWALAGAADGRRWTWGANAYGQLSDGTTAGRGVPHPTSGGAPAVGLAAGAYHGLAVDGLGTPWGWGDNGSGQLGTGSLTCGGNPCAVTDRMLGVTGALAVAGGYSHSLVLRADGRVLAAGGNAAGQLGDGTTTMRSSAIVVPGFALAANDALMADADGDGLVTWREYIWGTDPYNPDSNSNGLLDGDEALGSSPTHPDPDGDGVPSVVEAAWGTDPWVADTDGDSVTDAIDAFPLDPARNAAPAPTPGDTTPPVITLTAPTSARPRGPGL